MYMYNKLLLCQILEKKLFLSLSHVWYSDECFTFCLDEGNDTRCVA